MRKILRMRAQDIKIFILIQIIREIFALLFRGKDALMKVK